MLARPGLPSFEYIKADSADEVTRLLDQHGSAAKLLMGGTDLLIRMRNGLIRPYIVIDVKHLPGMQEVAYDEQQGLTVGAAVTMNQLARHPDVRAHYPLLAEACRAVGSYQLRNRATIGGNLCNASPASDTAPATLVLDGQIELYGPDGARQVPAGAFFLGPGKTAMQAGELMTGIHFSPPPANSAGRYLKLGRNKISDLALVSVAIWGGADETTVSGFRFRLALGAVAPTPLRLPGVEAFLAAHDLDKETLAQAAEQAAQQATPIDDVRSSAVYRKAMVRNLTLRGLQAVWEEYDARVRRIK